MDMETTTQEQDMKTLDTITLTMAIGYATLIDQALASAAEADDVDDMMMCSAAVALERIADARVTIRGCRMYADGTAKVTVTTRQMSTIIRALGDAVIAGGTTTFTRAECGRVSLGLQRISFDGADSGLVA
jgi:hypothetical protein